jgi:hypothetical protein
VSPLLLVTSTPRTASSIHPHYLWNISRLSSTCVHCQLHIEKLTMQACAPRART